jgi:hypothetical protein
VDPRYVMCWIGSCRAIEPGPAQKRPNFPVMANLIPNLGTMGTTRMEIGNCFSTSSFMRVVSHVPLKRHATLAPSGFRPGWQCSKTAVSPAFDTIDLDSEDVTPTDRLDYAADESEDDTREATSMSTGRPSTKNNGSSQVCLTNFYSY